VEDATSGGAGAADDGSDTLEELADADFFEDDEEETFIPFKARKARRDTQLLAQLAETSDVGATGDDFKTSYKPGRYEEGWLLSSLRSFYDQRLIRDVLGQVKGGKEASVYRCEAGPGADADGQILLAAKVYRPRRFRNLRNDKMYREGRPVLTAEGRAVKNSDQRIMRALGKKSAFGMEVQHTSWLMYEYTTMTLLHDAGAAVPRPLAAGENAILMAYRGDAQRAAPTLNEVSLDPDEAAALLDEVLRNVALMLQHDLIHGDLSAFNILYWEGAVTLIDFPQVVSPHTNENARALLRRDLARVCDYFARQGASRDPDALLDKLWTQFVDQDSATAAAAANMLR